VEGHARREGERAAHAVDVYQIEGLVVDREAHQGGAMIELSTDVSIFRRFTSDLDASSPRNVPEAPDLSRFARADIDAARLAWAGRIVDEYRSVAMFSELLRLLSDMEAPYPTLCTVHRLIGDELRHTELTARVVGWLGGHADLAIDLADCGLAPRRPDETAIDRALMIVARELVVGEQESIYALAAYRDATTEPAIKAVLELVLLDEVRHAAAGRALFAMLTGEDDRERLAPLLADDQATLRETYAASARGGPGRALGGSIELADIARYWRD
jgi:hypothetical protein